MKKNLKWLILALAVVILAAGAVAAVLLTGNQEPAPATEPPQPEAQSYEIYWNVERSLYGTDQNGETTRSAVDGQYRVRMAVNGEQVDVFFKSQSQVIVADSLYFMGLEFDEEGIVSRVVQVEEFTGGTAYLDFYVESFTQDSVTCNMGLNFRGPRVTYSITEDTKIYDVSDTSLMAGLPGELAEGCKAHGILNSDGTLNHLYVEKPFEPSPVYWNVDRMYDKTAQLSTRTPDDLGIYTITFAVDGQQVDLMCKDFTVVCAIDAYNAKCMGLEFDEEGYITKTLSTREATGNNSIASWYHILELTEDGFYAEKFSGSDLGKTASPTFAKDVKVYDVSGSGAYVGEPTELRLYDQVHALRNPAGQVCIVFVVNRVIDGQIYWNVERMWDATAKQTTRTPDSQGYYNLLMAVDGRQVTLRTKDKDIVNAIDARAAKCCVLRVEGNEILEFGAPAKSAYSISFASWCDVQFISGNTVKAKRVLSGDDQGTVYEGEMAEDCKVYNVSTSAAMVGEETTLQVGDRIHGLKGLDGKIHIIYVVSRPFTSPMYWNIYRTTYYDTKTKVSSRPQSEDGYWYFDLAVNEQVITVKTKNAELAQEMDSYIAMGLVLSSDNTVLKAVKYNEVKGYAGGSFASWYNVTSLANGKIVCERDGNSVSASLASGYTVYNVSSSSNMGKKTTLQVGDRVQCFKNEYDQVVLVYVVTRKLNMSLYWNRTRMYDSTNQVTTRTPEADGYYYMEFAYNGGTVTLKCADQKIVTYIDSRAAMCCALTVEDGVIESASTPTAASDCVKTFVSWADVTKIEGNAIAVTKSGTVTEGTLAENCKIYNVTGTEPFGAVTTVQVGDLIHGMVDSDGNVNYLFVIQRGSSGDTDGLVKEMYWNRTRMYDSTNKVTTRTPEADGYYYMEFAYNGGPVTLKCADQKIVTYIDSRAAMCCALTVEDGVIQSATVPTAASDCVKTFASWADVTKIEGTSIEVDKSGTKTAGILADDCQTYDVTGADPFGAVTTVQVGDLIHGIVDSDGNVNYLFVIRRGSSGDTDDLVKEMYWNRTRMYDSTNKVTTRTPEADGYYYMEFAYNGGPVTLKCADQKIVTYIDSRAAMCCALTVEDGVIQSATVPTAASGCVGTFASWADVTKIEGNAIAVTKSGTVTEGTLAADCKIYNVTGTEPFGAVTTVQVGDLIHGIVDSDGNVNYLFVIERAENTPEPPVTTEHKHCVCGGLGSVGDHTACGDVTWEAWDGTTTLESGKYYYLSKDITGWMGMTVAADDTITLCLNGKTITGASSVNRLINISGTLNLCDHKDGDAWAGSIISTKDASSMAPVFYVKENGVFNFYGGNLTATKAANEVGVGVVYKAIMNMYGGKIYGGTFGVVQSSTGKGGGNLGIFDKSVFTMYGGEISGGSSVQRGGNVYMNSSQGTFKMLGGLITGGTAANEGGGVFAREGSTVILGGSAKITGNAVSNLYMEGSMKLTITEDLTENAIGITLKNISGVFTETVGAEALAWFVSDAGRVITQNADGELEIKEDMVPNIVAHCACGAMTAEGQEVTHQEGCSQELLVWTAVDQAYVDENSGKLMGAPGNYYLTEDVKVTAQIAFQNNSAYNFDLNGYTVNMGTVNRLVAFMSADFNGISICFTDTADTEGSIVFGEKDMGSKQGSLVTIIDYSGTVTDCSVTFLGGIYDLSARTTNNRGGCINIDCKDTASTVNIYGGTYKVLNVTGASASCYGSFIRIPAGKTVNIKNATITGGTLHGTAANYCGTVYVAGTCILENTTITGCSADLGGGVYVASGGDLTVGSNTQITGNTGANLYLESGVTVQAAGTLGENAVGVTLASGTGVFTEAIEDANIAAFFSDEGLTVQKNADNKLEIVVAHCACGAMTEAGQEVTHQEGCSQELLIWTGIDQAYVDANEGKLMGGPGNYYLTENVSVTKQMTFQSDSAYNFDLNGYTVTVEDSVSRLIAIMNGNYNNISICFTDTAETKGSIVFEEKDVGTYQGILVTMIDYKGTVTDCTVTFLGGTYDLSARTTNNHGGSINIGCADTASTVNIYGGTYKAINVTGASASRYGGFIYIPAGKTVNIKNATITGGTLHGTAAKYCGTVYVAGTCILENTTITGCSADLGGGVYVKSGGDLTIGSNTQITGNTGANLYLESGVTVQVEGTLGENTVGVTLKSGTGVFTEVIVDEANIAAFFSDTGLTVLKNAEDKLELTQAE